MAAIRRLHTTEMWNATTATVWGMFNGTARSCIQGVAELLHGTTAAAAETGEVDLIFNSDRGTTMGFKDTTTVISSDRDPADLYNK